MAIDPRIVANLLAVAEHGSFNAAADALGISQPALSNSIALLERRLGVRLLERSRKGSQLNEYGEILVRRATSIRSLLKQAEEEIRLHREGVEGPLVVGATPSVTPRLVPLAVSILTAGAGQMDVSLIDGVHDQLLANLRSGEVDMVVGPIGGVTVPDDDIVEQFLIDDPYQLAVRRGSPLAQRKAMKLADLHAAPWVLPRRGTPFSRQIEAYFMTADLAWPADCLTCNSLSLLREIVCNTDRITIISRLQILGTGDGRLQMIPMQDSAPRQMGIKYLRNANMSPLAKRFMAALTEAAALCG